MGSEKYWPRDRESQFCMECSLKYIPNICYSPRHFAVRAIRRSMTVANALFNYLMAIILHTHFVFYYQKKYCFLLTCHWFFFPTGPIAINYLWFTSQTGTEWVTSNLRTYLSVTRPLCVNSSPRRQNGRHFDEKNILRRMFVNEKLNILVKYLLKFVPKGPIDNIPPLV